MTFRDLIRLVEAASKERLQIISNQFNLPLKTVEDLSQYDPSNGKYLTWIVKQVKNNTLRFPEDGDKVKERLTQFQQLSPKGNFKGEKDLNRYSSYGDLAKTIDDNLNVKTKGEIVRAAETEGAKLLDEQGVYKLYLVTTSEAAAKLFRNTEWCVKDPKFFNDEENYNPREFYYVTKNDKPYALLHLNSGQFMDVYDNPYEHERLPILEPIIIKNPDILVEYARDVIQGRWKEAEPYIIKDPSSAYRYAREVIKGRWKEAEPYTIKDPFSAYWYARDVIKGRWKEAEPIIIKDPKAAANYAEAVVKGRWKEAEPFIMKDPFSAYIYAKKILKHRWKEAEPYIMKDPTYAQEYKTWVIDFLNELNYQDLEESYKLR